METGEYQRLRAVEDEHWWFRALNDLVFRTFDSRLRGGDSVILDAGCGTGGLMARLAPLGRVEGVDASPVAVELARARGLENVRRDDLNAPDLRPEGRGRRPHGEGATAPVDSPAGARDDDWREPFAEGLRDATEDLAAVADAEPVAREAAADISRAEDEADLAERARRRRTSRLRDALHEEPDESFGVGILS